MILVQSATTQLLKDITTAQLLVEARTLEIIKTKRCILISNKLDLLISFYSAVLDNILFIRVRHITR